MVDISKFEELKDVVKSDETPLWAGKPQNFKLLDSVMKGKILLHWIVTLVIAVAALAVYISIYGGSETFQPLIVVVVVATALFFMLRPMMDKSALGKKVLYCVTDKRVILKSGRTDAYELARAGLKAKVEPNEAGGVNIKLGSCADIPAGKGRAKALSPKRGEGDMVTGFVLYNVDKCVEDFFKA